MYKLTLLFLLIVSVLLFSSCEKLKYKMAQREVRQQYFKQLLDSSRKETFKRNDSIRKELLKKDSSVNR